MCTVFWLDSVLDKLAEIYVNADTAERNRMAVGIDTLNRLLSDRPLEMGSFSDRCAADPRTPQHLIAE